MNLDCKSHKLPIDILPHSHELGWIFAHAYYSHREIFEQVEAESSLYARFLTLTSKFDLVPAEFLVIPPNQYGGEGDRDHSRGGLDHYPPHQPQQQQQQLDPITRAPGTQNPTTTATRSQQVKKPINTRFFRPFQRRHRRASHND
jgi:hypothetical protein